MAAPISTSAGAVREALSTLCSVLRAQGIGHSVEAETIRQAKFDGPVVSGCCSLHHGLSRLKSCEKAVLTTRNKKAAVTDTQFQACSVDAG